MDTIHSVKKLRNFWSTYKRDILIAVAIFVVAAVPRLIDLGSFLTADEKNWIGRSYEFVRAFKDLRFNDMLQTTHPGVTAMWTIGFSVTAKSLLGNIPFSFRNMFHFVAAAQFPIALMNSLAVPLMYIFLRRVFSGKNVQDSVLTSDKRLNFQLFVPVVASLFIALDPFVIGYSRVAHVDALLMSFLFLAVLATIIYAQAGYKRTWLIISAVLSSLALLTKAPAVFMFPFFGLLLLVFDKRSLFTWKVFERRLKDFMIWFLLIAIIFLVAWPALLWVPNPEGNVLVLKRDLGQAAMTSHDSNLGYAIEGKHYAYTLLTRTSPIILLLCVIAFTVLLLHQFSRLKFQITNKQIRMLWLFVAYIFFFIVMMTLGAKKGDRYIVAVWPALNVLAVFGLLHGSAFLFHISKKLRLTILRRPEYIFVGLSVIISVYAGFTVWSYHPYAIAYSNPLFEDNLSQELGWGEGLEQVGAWLSANDPNAVVASWYPEELGAYTSAQVAHINAHEQTKVKYVVLYRNMFGRSPEHYANDFIDEYYKKRNPVFTAFVHGKEFAWVYEKKVFEAHVGEITDGMKVGQEHSIKYDNFTGVEVLVATFSGRADIGSLVVRLKDGREGALLYSWLVDVAEIEDDRWLRLLLPNDVEVENNHIFVEISSVGVKSDNAPTVRFSRNVYFDTDVFVSRGESILESDSIAGSLGVRPIFLLENGEVANFEQVKLFQ